jgi:parallel beta-helix repeat protein
MLLILTFWFGAATLPDTASGANYYVATDGNDTNSGSQNSPFATLNKGAALLKPGDTLYVRGGTYHQSVYVGASGTTRLPVTISAYRGERAIIDGGYSKPVSDWGALFLVEGSNVVVQHITIKRSNWMGLALKGQYDQAIDVTAQANMENGILVTGNGSYSLVEGCTVYSNVMSNEQFQKSRGGWSSGLSAARGANNVTLRNNRIWNNWGEGLSTYEAKYTLMEGNTVYDNMLNVYLSDTKYSTLQRNLIYCTSNNLCSNVSQVGIGLGDETYNPPSSDNKIVNNLLLGNAKNIYYWPGSSGGGLVNVVIAYNTCVDSSVETNLKLGTGKHSNSVIANNIFMQEDSLAVAVVETARGLTFSNNLWSKRPLSAAAGRGDVIGNPHLFKTGNIGPGQLSAGWFRFPASSPAVGAAGRLGNLSVDFFGASRGDAPDIGAMQHRTTPPPGHSSHGL